MLCGSTGSYKDILCMSSNWQDGHDSRDEGSGPVIVLVVEAVEAGVRLCAGIDRRATTTTAAVL
jgi:hypothetical protein